MRGRWWLGLLLAIAVGSFTGCNPIVYLYDEIGRLIAVVVPGAATTVYSYDAVGNVTEIDTHPTSQLDVISVRPRCGSLGTSVTIRGTGFGAPAMMAVRFTGPTPSGIAATITTRDDTTLVATAPGGALSGPIHVSNGSTTVDSASFSIPCGAAPAITGLVPPLGVVGMPVTVVGAGFPQAQFGMSLAFNGTPGMIYASTPTSIATAVPAQATTGPISVSTPFGSTTSGTSFEVVTPPGFLTPDDIEVVIAMSIGQTGILPIADPTKRGLVRFDGTASTLLTVQRTGAASVLLYDPNGQGVQFSTNTDAVLPVTGRYTIAVRPSAPNGSVSITLSAKPVLVGSRLYLHDATLPGLGKRMNPKLGTGATVSSACADAGSWTFHDAAGQPITWYSPPLAVPVFIAGYGCCPADFAPWGLESSGQTDGAFAGTLGVSTISDSAYWFDGTDDVEMVVGTSGCASGAPGGGAALHTWQDTLSVGPLNLAVGARLWVRLRAGQAPGTSGPTGGSGRNAQLHYNRNTADVDGASHVDFPKTLVFDCSNPAECGP